MSFFNRSEIPVLTDTTLIPKCGACGLFKTCESPKLPPGGKGKKKVLIIGEAPGGEEDKEGKQAVGNAWQDMERRLMRLGVDMRRDCTLTSALICRPPENKIKSDKAVEFCRPNLIKTIRQTNPEVIIPLGGRAIESLIEWTWGQSPGAVARWIGYCIPDQKTNAWIVPNFHPSYLLHDGNNRVAELMFAKALEKAVSKIGKGRPHDKIPNHKSDIDLIFDAKHAAEAIYRLTSMTGPFAYDIETNMLKPHHKESDIVCCSISNGRETIVFPWCAETKKAMLVFFKDKNAKKIASNMMMEDGWSWVFGCRPKGWFHDTMLCAHVLENASKVRNISGLKFQAYVHFGYPDYASHLDRYLHTKDKSGYSKNRIRQADKRLLYHYCGLDSLYEHKLAKLQCECIGKDWPT